MNPEKGRYYGPYTDVRAMHATLDFLKKNISAETVQITKI